MDKIRPSQDWRLSAQTDQRRLIADACERRRRDLKHQEQVLNRSVRNAEPDNFTQIVRVLEVIRREVRVLRKERDVLSSGVARLMVAVVSGLITPVVNIARAKTTGTDASRINVSKSPA